MLTREQALDTLSRIRTSLLDSCAGLDAATLERHGMVGEWSVKNVLAHLAAWEEWVVQVLPVRIATGSTPADFRARTQDEDRFNAEEVAEREELTFDEQLMELERTRAELLSYLRSLDDATLARTHLWPGYDGALLEYVLEALGAHETEHIEGLRAALARA